MKPPYEITHKVLERYGQISEALGLCQSLLLVRPEARLRKQNRIQTIQSSLAIEGNTLNVDQVTAIFEKSRVVGPAKEILEVQNAINVYEALSSFNPYLVDDFLRAHLMLMQGLVPLPGHFRNSQVGILKGDQVSHIAPGFLRVPDLMRELFDYLKNDQDLALIKSCVFHYEMEFIHPFEDGNGRMGRLWQTRLLMNVNPIFEFVPLEKVIKEHQAEYYQALEKSDQTGASTPFLEYMMEVINEALRGLINDAQPSSPDYSQRTAFALSVLEDWFDRKDYRQVCKGISTATASRDIKQMLEEGKIQATGSGRMTKYKKVRGRPLQEE